MYPTWWKNYPHPTGTPHQRSGSILSGPSCALLKGWSVIQVSVEHRGSLPSVSHVPQCGMMVSFKFERGRGQGRAKFKRILKKGQ